MSTPAPSYRGYRFPPEIISHTVWLYHRFGPSFRDVEDLLAQRGIIVSFETIRGRLVVTIANIGEITAEASTTHVAFDGSQPIARATPALDAASLGPGSLWEAVVDGR